jgi:multicomponent Na+:H+ antiporter subunit B
MMTVVFGIFLLTLLVITAIGIVRSHNLFTGVMLSGIFSLLMAANFFVLDAADVALTEAAVGAGISTVLLLGALALTPPRERREHGGRWLAVGVVTLTTLVVIYATFQKPPLGDPNAPVHVHVAPWYLEKTPELVGIPNVVTAVLGSYRAYDTLGEVIVVLTAGIGVLFLLGLPGAVGDRKPEDVATGRTYLSHHLVPQVVGRLLIPFILLFALYVQFHGEYGPGGGFQAGAIFAAAIILYALIDGEREALEVISPRLLIWMMAGGALLYGGVGVLTMLLGGNFLDYNVLHPDPMKGQQYGIIAIELGVGVTVAGVMLAIYHAFAARGR